MLHFSAVLHSQACVYEFGRQNFSALFGCAEPQSTFSIRSRPWSSAFGVIK